MGGGAKGAAGPSPGVVGRPGWARWGGDERGGLLHTHSARSSMCEHGRQRSRCVACGGASVCKEVRWWATDRLVCGPTVTLAAFRSLRPCTCWIMADRRGGGVAVEGKCGVRNKMPVGVHPTWWSHLQIDWADAETGAVTAGLLGATSRPPVCGVYQGGPTAALSHKDTIREAQLVSERSSWRSRRPGSI